MEHRLAVIEHETSQAGRRCIVLVEWRDAGVFAFRFRGLTRSDTEVAGEQISQAACCRGIRFGPGIEAGQSQIRLGVRRWRRQHELPEGMGLEPAAKLFGQSCQLVEVFEVPVFAVQAIEPVVGRVELGLPAAKGRSGGRVTGQERQLRESRERRQFPRIGSNPLLEESGAPAPGQRARGPTRRAA